MSIPFLKSKDGASPSFDVVELSKQKDQSPLEICCQELIDAVHSKDASAVASCIKSILDVAKNEPESEMEMS